jgi:hypothetical protein
MANTQRPGGGIDMGSIPEIAHATTAVPDAEPPTGRTEERTVERDSLADWGHYEAPIDRHMRFEMEESAKRAGFDYFWAAMTIAGQPNPRVGEYWRAGWRPARAKDYPRQSGLDLDVDPRLVELGFMKKVLPDDPIVDGGLVLCLRPMQYSLQSRKNDRYEADKALYDKTEALRQQSRRAIGDKTQLSRTYTRGIPPDQIPDSEA